MAVRNSVEVTNDLRECRYLLSAFPTEGNHVAGTLTGIIQPNLEENDEIPGFGSVMVGLNRHLNVSLTNLLASDSALIEAVGWESTLRNEHREMSEMQGLLLVALRRAVMSQYEDPDLENLGLQPIDVRDSVTVSRRSTTVSERFEAPNLHKMLGKARFKRPTDLESLVKEIREAAKELASLLERIHEAERRTARARLEKNKIQKAHRKVFLRTARVFEDFCRLAGDDDLADKIRRTARSRPSTPEPGEGEDVVDEPADTAEVVVSTEAEVSSQEA